MVIELKAAEKQKGLGGIDARGPYLNRLEVIGLCRRHHQFVDAEIDPRADRGCRTPAAAPQGVDQAEDALCAPGRPKPAYRGDPRQRTGSNRR